METKNELCFIRQSEVTRLTSIPKSTLAEKVKEGTFPSPVDLATRSRAWVKSEVHAWMKKKLEERDEKEKKQ